jgi:ankyrin repeat protein
LEREGDTVTNVFEVVTAGDLEALRRLVAANPSAASARDEHGLSAVLQAQYRGRDDMVAVLLEAGPELDVFEASALGNIDRAGAVLDANPGQVNAWSADGFSPLHLAVFFGHAPTARMLIARGADVGAVSRNPMEVMPLHSAAAGRSRASVEAVLDADVDVNAGSHGGFTALHDAAQNGDRAIVELLLDRGADPGMTDERGRTAQALAIEQGHLDVADLLDARG